MNVVTRTDEHLELAHTPMPWIIGLGCVLFVLCIGLLKALAEGAFGGIIISLAMLAALGWIMMTRILRTLRVIAHRGLGKLRISATTLRGETSAEYPLSDLVCAEIETRHDKNTSRPEPTLVLVMNESSEPPRLRLDPFRPDPLDLLHACESINTWLSSRPATTATDTSAEASSAHESH